jgi:hypothetical protein
MPEHEGSRRQKQEEVDSRKHIKEKESESLRDQINTWGQDKLSLDETPFQPPVERHAAMLAKTRHDPQRANLVLNLQRTYGNAYVQRLLESHAIQAKLTVSQPDDIYEQEAERVSEVVTMEINSQVKRQPEEEEEETGSKSFIQRQEEEEEETVSSLQFQPEEEEEKIQFKIAGSQPVAVADDLEASIERERGNGLPLSDVIRGPMERAFEADFSGVKVHTDTEADIMNRQLNARAFTTGQDIFFREGEYSPSSSSGQKLIAHELTHVVQQGKSGVNSQRHKKKTVNTGSVTFGSEMQKSLWGSNKRVQSLNFFASRALHERMQVAFVNNAPDIQCYKTNIGRVTFESKGWGPTIAGGLQTTVTANDITVGSQDYEPQVTVEAAGPAASVANYKVGFLQTFYGTERNFYYRSLGLAPVKEYLSTRLNRIPCRDGNPAGNPPWYDDQNLANCDMFANAAKSSKTIKMYDSPRDGAALQRKGGGVNQYLVKTDGKDIFRTWVAIQNVNTRVKTLMNWVDWEVDWSTDVQNNPGAPAVNVTGGGKIVGYGEGPGSGKMPSYMGPVCNNSVIRPKPVKNW